MPVTAAPARTSRADAARRSAGRLLTGQAARAAAEVPVGTRADVGRTRTPERAGMPNLSRSVPAAQQAIRSERSLPQSGRLSPTRRKQSSCRPLNCPRRFDRSLGIASVLPALRDLRNRSFPLALSGHRPEGFRGKTCSEWSLPRVKSGINFITQTAVLLHSSSLWSRFFHVKLRFLIFKPAKPR